MGEVYLPGAGWIGFDPSCGKSGRRAVCAHGDDAASRTRAAGVSGTYFGFARDFLGMEVNLYVRKVGVDEPPEKPNAGASQAQLQTLRA